MDTTYLILSLFGCLCGAVTVIGWAVNQGIELFAELDGEDEE